MNASNVASRVFKINGMVTYAASEEEAVTQYVKSFKNPNISSLKDYIEFFKDCNSSSSLWERCDYSIVLQEIFRDEESFSQEFSEEKIIYLDDQREKNKVLLFESADR